jgi:hypothetical protein
MSSAQLARMAAGRPEGQANDLLARVAADDEFAASFARNTNWNIRSGYIGFAPQHALGIGS